MRKEICFSNTSNFARRAAAKHTFNAKLSAKVNQSLYKNRKQEYLFVNIKFISSSSQNGFFNTVDSDQTKNSNFVSLSNAMCSILSLQILATIMKFIKLTIRHILPIMTALRTEVVVVT